jgi:putative Mn2+ efflux pump MntP
MDVITIIIIALALAVDSFAVSIACGITVNNLRITKAIKIATFFGFFQTLMLLLGWLGGVNLIVFISSIDHWIAFGLLSVIGIRMIYGSIKSEKKIIPNKQLGFRILTILSIATSIDALAVGISYALLDVFILTPILVIGIVTFSMAFLGVIIGRRFGHFFEKKIQIVGGVILIGIGIKILLEHLV